MPLLYRLQDAGSGLGALALSLAGGYVVWRNIVSGKEERYNKEELFQAAENTLTGRLTASTCPSLEHQLSRLQGVLSPENKPALEQTLRDTQEICAKPLNVADLQNTRAALLHIREMEREQLLHNNGMVLLGEFIVLVLAYHGIKKVYHALAGRS